MLENQLKDIKQQPRWVDGSGLSRYNLFSPMSFVDGANQTIYIHSARTVVSFVGGEFWNH